MSQRSRIAVDVVLDVPPEDAFTALTDWPAQSEWVIATTVRNTKHDGLGVGGEFEAFTGVGRIGVLDSMVVIGWEPPHRVVVQHTGRVVRGIGVFEVFALPDRRSRFVWSEELDLPLGRLGRAVWPVGRPVLRVGVRRSLHRFRDSLGAQIG